MADFKSAFASARKAGKKEFSWNGKKYNTKIKGEGGGSKAAPSTSTRPKARPTTSAATGPAQPPKAMSSPRPKARPSRTATGPQTPPRAENASLPKAKTNTVKRTVIVKGSRTPPSAKKNK